MDNEDSLGYLSIEVPDRNDSLTRIVLDGKVYFLRFTWNMRGDFWTFGLYDALEQPIVLALKVVPNCVLNLYVTHLDLPNGAFIALTTEDRIGRKDFQEGKAEFIYMTANQEIPG